MRSIAQLILAGLFFSLAALPAKAEETALPFQFGGPFELVDHEGKPRTEKDFRGSFMLVYFGYTYCPDICPTDLFLMNQALEILGEDARKVQPLFISVDPGRDRPEILKEYVANFHPGLIGLTGSENQVRAAAKAYRVHRVKVPQPDEGEDDYLVNHSSLTYLMGPDGHFLSLIPHGTAPERMAEIIGKYISQGTAGS
ncbi:SCO family protein [Aestuariispira insulae]|uniref:Protein SCO1/2 n=1 Tax=Aestuariispira insulae TaxID=1461337 RepID=A0A3D9HQB3_9PROT|nr:SCO family protein [Aestuariispira insulae]RED51585.1 protein SCO1/2 [Aestuariispira insulae]